MYHPLSLQGREVVELQGDDASIRRRGHQITRLGNRMVESADFLEGLAGQTDDQRGEAVEKLREVVGDTYHELRRAGNMYQPTGPVLVTYANNLSEAQPKVNAAVEKCHTRWGLFQSAPGFLPGERPGWGAPEEGTPEAEANERADATKQFRHERWTAAVQEFDSEMDTWETAFDQAVNGIGEILDGSIKDSFWDNVDGFVGGALVVLQWAGIILGIAAIIIGGPIIALLSAIVGILTLAFTIYQFARGDAGWGQLALAIVGVIPFGSLGKLFQGQPGRMAFLGDMFPVFKGSTWTAAGGQLRNLGIVNQFAGGGMRGFLASGRAFLTMNNPNGVGDIMMRLMFGKDVNRFSNMADALGGGANGWCLSSTLPAAFEFGHTLVSGSWKLTDRIATWTGNGDKKPSSLFPWVGAFM